MIIDARRLGIAGNQDLIGCAEVENGIMTKLAVKDKGIIATIGIEPVVALAADKDIIALAAFN